MPSTGAGEPRSALSSLASACYATHHCTLFCGILGKHLNSGKLLGRFRERIKQWLFVDKYLLGEHPLVSTFKQTDRNCVIPLLLEAVKQMGATFAAESTLSPIGRIKNRYVVGALELNITLTLSREKGAATPFEAHRAMTRTNTVALSFSYDANRTA